MVQTENIMDRGEWKIIYGALIALSLFLGGCGAKVTGTEGHRPEANVVSTNAGDGVSKYVEEEAVTPEAVALREGRTEELVGISLGDDFDYERFDVLYRDLPDRYRHADPKYQDICYYFDGEGHRFSGFYISSYEENTYFGIRFGQDGVADLKEMFGEPDFYGKPEELYCGKDANERMAVWQFERATLALREKDYKIFRLEYMAAEGVADGQGESETELARDCREAHATVESIYQWTEEEENDREFYTDDAHYFDGPDVAADEDEIRESVVAYLEQNGFGGQMPTGTIEDILDGWGRFDYYVDEQEQKYCFILWLYHYRDGKVTDAQCVTRSLADAEYKGVVLGEQDKTGGVTREREYDKWGRKRAEVSYRYREGIVFPFITEGWNLDDGEFLCRNQMMTFSEAYSIFDDTGKFVGTRDISQDKSSKGYLPLMPYLFYNSTCIYGEDGRLETLKEELQEDDIEMRWGPLYDPYDYSGRLDFQYRADGTPRQVDYLASEYTHGTYKSSGRIRYDEQGRICYDSFYVTHGGDVYIYLYRENEERPWARIDWCSMLARGFEAVTLFVQNTESLPLFDDFGEMDYALFLETGVGYPESAIIPTYGIYGDFTKQAEDGTELYVTLNNMIGKEIPISTISDLNYWNQYTEEHIVNISQDLDRIVSRQFDSGLRDAFYCENWYAGGSIVKKSEGNLSISIGDFLFSKNPRENISQIQQKNNQIQNLLNDLYQQQIGESERTWFCLDEFGKILAVRTKENESENIFDIYQKECIRIYNVSGDQAEMLYQFSAPETEVNWDIEISQIVGDEKNGWVVFSAGTATYRMQYPEGVTEKIGEFMYGTTYSPDGKYRAFCTGNMDLYDSWQGMYKESDYDEELLVWYREMRSRWDTIPAGWYVEELETGNKTYIPIKSYVPINHVLPSIGYGRCTWIDKKKLFELLDL